VEYELIAAFMEARNKAVDYFVGYGDFNRGEADFMPIRGDVKGICQGPDCCE
jgi:hypothetical protein